MDTLSRFWVRTILSYGAGLALLAFFLRNTEWRVLAEDARSIAWLVLAGATVLRLASLVVGSLRWQALLAPVHAVPLGGIIGITMMGMAVNAVAPMQTAEIFRPLLLSRRQGLDFRTTFATVTVEWLLDALGVFALFVPALFWVRIAGLARTGLNWSRLARVLTVCALLAVAGLAALRFLPRSTARFASFTAGLQILNEPRRFAAVGAYSVLASALTAMSAWMSLVAVGLPVSFAAGFLVLGLITIGGMVPTPGAIGGFHAVCQLGLVAFFNVDRARTVLPVLAMHAVLYVPAAVIGAVCFLWPARAPQPH